MNRLRVHLPVLLLRRSRSMGAGSSSSSRCYGEYEQEDVPSGNPTLDDTNQNGTPFFRGEGVRTTRFDFNHRYKELHPRMSDVDGTHAFAANRLAFFVSSCTHYTLLEVPYLVVDHAGLAGSRRFCLDGLRLFHFNPTTGGLGCFDMAPAVQITSEGGKVDGDPDDDVSRAAVLNRRISMPADASIVDLKGLTGFVVADDLILLFSREGGEGGSNTLTVVRDTGRDSTEMVAQTSVAVDVDVTRVHVQHVTADLSLVVGTALNGTVLCLAALDQKKKSMRVVLDGADSHHSGGGALYCSAVVGTHVWGVLLPGQSSIQYVDMRAWLEMWLHTDAHAPPHALLQTDFVLSEQYLGLKPIGTHRLELGPCLAGGEGSSAWGALSNATYESGISSCYLHIFRTALDHTQTPVQFPHTHAFSTDSHQVLSWSPNEGTILALTCVPAVTNAHALSDRRNTLVCLIKRKDTVRVFVFQLKS